jgi:hypothetical protein
MRMRFLVLFGIAALVAALVVMTSAKKREGFEDVENPLTPAEFSYGLLQGVMGPIRRLSGQLIDMKNWKERIELAQLSPTELARRHLSKAAK